MTKEKIKAMIAEKIAGQGSQVDTGGGLAPILDAIVDAIPAGKDMEFDGILGRLIRNAGGAVEISEDEYEKIRRGAEFVDAQNEVWRKYVFGEMSGALRDAIDGYIGELDLSQIAVYNNVNAQLFEDLGSSDTYSEYALIVVVGRRYVNSDWKYVGVYMTLEI